MKVLELFSGTESFSKIARERGHETFTIDIDPYFKPDLCINILDLKLNDLPFKPDIIWASPPCQKFSVSTIGKNWNRDHTPKTKEAENALNLIDYTIGFIINLNPKYFFIENPRGNLRKVITFGEIRTERKTVSYCQYGDNRMKPTDIWSNCKRWSPKPICKIRSLCHVSAPRGSVSGTQGLKNSKERAVIPPELCLEILKECEK